MSVSGLGDAKFDKGLGKLANVGTVAACPTLFITQPRIWLEKLL